MELASFPAWEDTTRESDAGQAQWPAFEQPQPHPNDHFVKRDGLEFAGTHLIIDLFDARSLDDLALMEATLRRAVGLDSVGTASPAALVPLEDRPPNRPPHCASHSAPP